MLPLERFIEETNSALSAEAVFQMYQNTLEQLGFDRVIYSLITDHPSLNRKAGHGIQRNYPSDWMKHYSEKRYEKIDPVPKHAFVTARPFTWEHLINNHELSLDEKLVMNEAEDAKLLDGVGIPIYGPNGEIAGAGLASSLGGIKPNKNMLCLLRALTYQFHLAYAEHDPAEVQKIEFSSREKEILLWAAEGKSDPVIADIIGLSYPTVRYHMSNIFKKLGVNERTFAVVKALRMGVITPSFVNPDYQTR